MTEQEKVSTFHYQVEPFEEDFLGTLSWSVLGNRLLRVAGIHADMHGFGYHYFVEYQRAWVLSRLEMEVSSMPRTDEHYSIETFVNKVYRQFTDRCFVITNESNGNEVIGYAHTIWSLIDFNTRMPVNLDTLPDEGFRSVMVEREVPLAPPARVRVKSTTPVSTHLACYSDLDINGHVNSIRYITLMLDLFTKEQYETQRPFRIEVAFAQESYIGDMLHIYREEVDKDTFQFEIRKAIEEDKEQLLVRAQITLK